MVKPMVKHEQDNVQREDISFGRDILRRALNSRSSSPQAWLDFDYVDFTSKTGDWQKWQRISLVYVGNVTPNFYRLVSR